VCELVDALGHHLGQRGVEDRLAIARSPVFHGVNITAIAEWRQHGRS